MKSILKSVGTIAQRGLDLGFRRGRLYFSQYGEDIIVKFVLENMGIQHPRYIDIGASHPYVHSNTALFYRLGSQGINVEADPELFAAFPRVRKRDINLNVGVLDSSGERDFYVSSQVGLSTLLKQEAESRLSRFNIPVRRVVKVRVLTLNEILAQYALSNPPQFMSIDTEGADEQILRALDFTRWSPEVICCETVPYSPAANGQKNESLIQFLESRGYFVLGETSANTIFVLRKAWQRVLAARTST